MDPDLRSSQRLSSCRGAAQEQDLPFPSVMRLFQHQSTHRISLEAVILLTTTHHVKPFEPNFYGNPSGQAIIHTRAYDKLLGILEHPPQFRGCRNHIERHTRFLPGPIDFIVTVFVDSDCDSHVQGLHGRILLV